MKVYLDNAATTPIAPEVIEAMIPVLRESFGNPSSAHSFGRTAKAIIENSRRSIAKTINCQPAEILFNSGGTEGDNMAIHCCVHALGVKRIITTTLEHHAVGHTAEDIARNANIKLEFVNVSSTGLVDLVHLGELLKSDEKTLVSLMHANNEIGTLLPLEKVSSLCKKYNAYLHSDTVQTMGHYHFDLEKLNIDFLTCSAHKFHGPKGIGFLYVNKSIKMKSLIMGGGQERGLRAGTENIYGIVGLAKAFELAYGDLEEHQNHVQELKSHMIRRLKAEIDDVSFHGEIDPDFSLYTVLNVCFPKTEKAGMLLFTLDLKGIAASGGSACSSGAVSSSHVLSGIKSDPSRPNVRFSFSRYTTLEEVNYAVDQVVDIFEKTLA